MRGVFTKHYDGKALFERFEVELVDGGINRITGPSGRGKTTLMRIMSGLEANEEGGIGDFEGRSSAWVFQEDRLAGSMGAAMNIALAVGRSARDKGILEALSELGLDDAHKRIDEYSGGMKRRVAIARALLSEGEILYLDEPFTGLDAATRALAAAFILRKRNGRTLVLVTHEDDGDELLPAEHEIVL